jgi:hypothetical protein
LFIYWIIFLIIATGALLSRKPDFEGRRSSFAFVLLASLPTLLMIGLRWRIGPDWDAYVQIFESTQYYSFGQALTHGDAGFTSLNWLLNQLGAPFWTVNLVCGAVFVAGLTAFSRRQPNPWLAFLIALPYMGIVVAMSGDRQSLALGFLFFALNAFQRGKLSKFVLLILVAALFHGSILLILPLALLSYSQNSVQRAVLIIIALVIAYYFFQGMFSIYAHRYSSEKIQSTGVAYRLAMNALAAIIFLTFPRRFGLGEHELKLWRNISLASLGLLLLLAVFPSSTAIDRFLLYLFPLQFLVLSRAPTALSPDQRTAEHVTVMVIGYAALVQATFLFFGTFAIYYVPYRSIFQG